MNNGIIITSDSTYLGRAKTLIKSIKRTNPKLSIFLKLINSNIDCELKSLENVSISSENIEFEKKRYIKNKKEVGCLFMGSSFNSDIFTTKEKTYTCHSRFEYALSILKNNINIQNILIVDCDFIFRNNIIDLFERKEDVLIHNLNSFHHEDAIFIKNSNNGKRFLEVVIEKLNENIFFWDQDTIALEYAFKQVNALYGELPLIYKDYTLQDNSPVWSGDGIVKHSEKYKDEEKMFGVGISVTS